MKMLNQKWDLYHTCGITPKHVTSGGARLCDLAPRQHSLKETLQQRQAAGNIMPICPAWKSNSDLLHQ